MSLIDFPIDRLNTFFKTHVFEVFTQPTHDENHSIVTNVKVELTGVKEYIKLGNYTPYVEYTMYILPSNKESDMWYALYADAYGSDVTVGVTDRIYYSNLIFAMNHKLSDFLPYLGINKPALCTRVINMVPPKEKKLKESIHSDFEKMVRKWFKKNSNKHTLDPEAIERVIKKVLSEK